MWRLLPQFRQRQHEPGVSPTQSLEETLMNGGIYLVGLVVVVMFVLSFLGLR
jgi:hypothetical protein